MAKEGTYELQFKQGSFHDFETELTINREDQVEVKEPMGQATLTAIASGRLLFVHEPKPKKAAKPTTAGGTGGTGETAPKK